MYPSKTAAKLKCRGETSSGRPCQRWAMKGSLVCATHGGKAPQVQAKAQERIEITRDEVVKRLFSLVEPSILALEQIIGDPEARLADRMRAIEIVMDRTVGKKIEVGVEDTDEKDLDDEIEQAFGATLAATGTDSVGTVDEWLEDDDDDHE